MNIVTQQHQPFYAAYSFLHLLDLWIVLTGFLLIFSLMVMVIGLYPSAKQFWKVQSIILVGSYLLSALCFLVFHWNALAVIGGLACLALIVQGDLGVKERAEEGLLEDWWAFRFVANKKQTEEPDV